MILKSYPCLLNNNNNEFSAQIGLLSWQPDSIIAALKQNFLSQQLIHCKVSRAQLQNFCRNTGSHTTLFFKVYMSSNKVSHTVNHTRFFEKSLFRLQVMREFRDGGYNTLVSTCVGEEGPWHWRCRPHNLLRRTQESDPSGAEDGADGEETRRPGGYAGHWGQGGTG